MAQSFLHTFDLGVYDNRKNRVGDIEVMVEYVVDSFGSPARVNCLPEDAHPAEPAEINIVNVEMLDAPTLSRATYIPAWDWLYAEACEWCEDNATELAAAASLEIKSNREYYADMQREKTNGYA